MNHQKEKIVLYCLRELHFPVLLPVYRELKKLGALYVGFMAPPYRESHDGAYQEGLKPGTLHYLNQNEIPFWGHAKQEDYACVVTADVCYDRIDGWGPIVCVGHGTISKGIYFTDSIASRRENFAAVLCVPGPWYQESYGRQVFTRVEATGFSKMDELAVYDPMQTREMMQKVGFSPGKKTILFAPTFNPEFTSTIHLFDQWRKLDPQRYQVFFKLHGVTHEKIKRRYEALAADHGNFHYVKSSSIVPYMHACDIMVSDVSSVYVEFFALDKPVILYNSPGITNYHGYNPENIEYRVRNAGYQIEKPEHIHNILQALDFSDPLKPKRRHYSKVLFPRLDGRNSRRIAEQVLLVANGDIRLNKPKATQHINVYIHCHGNTIRQIEENLKNTLFPVDLYTHQKDLRLSKDYKLLNPNESPPLPFIIMTGENAYPLQWDYIWYAAEYFINDSVGIFGPVMEDTEQNAYQQAKYHLKDHLNGTQSERQGRYKYQLLGLSAPVPSLKDDGAIVTNVVPDSLLKKCFDDQDGFKGMGTLLRGVKQAGLTSHVLYGFYSYHKKADEPNIHARSILHSTNAPQYLVTAIVSAYKSEQFLRGCLQGLEEQSIADRLEIIVVDSGSPENEAAIVREFQAGYTNINYIKTESRETIYSAWNRAIRIAKGKYLTNANTDDRLHPNAYQILSNELEQRTDCGVVYANQYITNIPNQTFDGATIAGKHSWPDFSNEKLLEFCCVGPQPMWRKSIHDQCGLFDGNLEVAGDYDFWLRICDKISFKHIDQFLGLYYRSVRQENKEFENRYKTYSETYQLQRNYLLKLIGTSPANHFNHMLQKMIKEINQIVMGFEARAHLQPETKRFLEYLFWKSAVFAEAAGNIEQSKTIARSFFTIYNESYRNAFHLRDILTKTKPEKKIAGEDAVSVVIPCHNAQHTIRDTVASVLNQSYRNCEIILVNDGSTDNSGQVLDEIKSSHPHMPIKIVNQDNKGPARARNNAIRLAAGEYILTLDSDDQIAFDFIEKTIAEFRNHKELDVVFSESVFYGAKNKIWALQDVSLPGLFSANQLTVTSLFRKQVWEEVGGFDESMQGYEDWCFWIAIAKKGYKFKRVAEPLFLYRHNHSSRNYRVNKNDIRIKLQLMRKHPDIYRLPSDSEMGLLGEKEFIPPAFVRPNIRNGGAISSGQMRRRNHKGKVLFVCHDFPPYKYAGAQLYAYNLAKELIGIGYDASIFYPVDVSCRKPGESRELYDIVKSFYNDIPVYQINIDARYHGSQFYNPRIDEKFQRLLMNAHYDYVHFHLLFRLSNSLPCITKRLGVPSVATLHDYWFLCFGGHMIDSRLRECSGPESYEKCAQCANGFKDGQDAILVNHFKERMRMSKTAYESIDYVISPSNFLADIHAHFGFARPAVSGLGWIPVTKYRTRPVEQTVTFGYCGQIIIRKGLDVLIAALKRIKAKNWKLKIFGIGYEPNYFSFIEEQIAGNPQFEYLGGYVPADLAEIYSQIDVAVVPSRRENYPLSLLEALSAKVPIIASDVGGIKEIVTDGKEGFIFQNDDIPGLVKILERITAVPSVINELRSNIQSIKSIHANACEIDELYQSLPSKIQCQSRCA